MTADEESNFVTTILSPNILLSPSLGFKCRWERRQESFRGEYHDRWEHSRKMSWNHCDEDRSLIRFRCRVTDRAKLSCRLFTYQTPTSALTYEANTAETVVESGRNREGRGAEVT
ncbi:hypothetical protein RvY_02536 [Ramazzottius varieornatus]|uniref:Uncharacterized protein n=1 Tax=Ramazzottius varieornatus TaxID=947166 RepID=A0A1D1UUL1_RAMVA|nr:hypothetical protein RvY_02536 [Ramazzottius varieornatus]